MQKPSLIAITGAGGFLGSATLRFLQQNPMAKLRALYSRTPSLGRTSHLTPLTGELADPRTAADLVRGADTVLHFATRGFPIDSTEKSIEENLISSRVLLRAMAEAGTRRLILASSGGAVYAGGAPDTKILESSPTGPSDWYGKYKLAVESMAGAFGEQNGISVYSMRISNPYGPGQYGRTRQGILGVAVQCALEGKPLKLWASLDTQKDFIFIDDLAELLVQVALDPAIAAGTYNVGSGRGTRLGDALAEIERATQSKIQVDPGENAHPIPSFTALDSSKIFSATGWTARTPLRIGILRLVNACQSGRKAA